MIIIMLLASILAKGAEPFALMRKTSCEVTVKKSSNARKDVTRRIIKDFCSNMLVDKVVSHYHFEKYGDRYISIDNTSLKEIKRDHYRSAGVIKNTGIKVKELYDYRVIDDTGVLYIRFDIKGRYEKFSIKQSLTISEVQ